MGDAPSDRLQETYELRARLEYGRVAPPDPRIDRKFERICELVLDQLPRESFLDAGCGDGRHLAALAGAAGRPRRIVGADISDRILDTARAAVAATGAHVELVRANVESLPFEDEAFDLVLCSQVIEHLLDVDAGLTELRRVLRPGGVLVISTDHSRNVVTTALNWPRDSVVRLARLQGRRRQVTFPHASYRLEEFQALLTASGFRVRHMETFRFHLRWPLNVALTRRLLSRLDKALAPHRIGDIIAVVAEKPAA